MIIKSKIALAVLGAFCAMPVMAADAVTPSHKEGIHVIPTTAKYAITSNVALVSNYLYRGISQTGANPAIQGGFDLGHASGFYAGVWGSSISWISDAGSATNAGTEIDTYAGYKGKAGSVDYDIGYLRYNYPGTYGADKTKADTDEVYAALTYSIVTAKLSYSLGDTFGITKAQGTTYAELNASYPVGATGYTLTGHVGKQNYKGATADANADGSLTYTDYKVGVTKDFSGYVVGLAYSTTNAVEKAYTVLNKNLGKSATVLSLSRTF